MNTIKPAILTLIAGCLLSGCVRDKATFQASIVRFDDIFDHVDSITISSDSIMGIRQLIVRDSEFVVMDDKIRKILKINQEGTILSQHGGIGKGPEEFINPVWLGNGQMDDYFVVDAGNNRLSVFDENGFLKYSFTLRSSGPFTNTFHLYRNNREVFILTNTAFCLGNPGETCVFQVYDTTGDRINSFGAIKEIDSESPGVPFYSTLFSDSLLYVQHSLGEAMSVFNLDGEKLHEFSTSRSPATMPIDVRSLPNDVYRQVQQIKASSYTYVTGIFSLGKNVLIQFRRSGEELDNLPTRFLEIYDLEGNLKYWGIDTEYRVIGSNHEFVLFLESEETSEESTYTLHKYRINNLETDG